jgi:hypothetical protein
MMIDRRHFLATIGAAAGGHALVRATPRTAPVRSLPPMFDDLAERTFRFFWDTANPANGLVPDRWPTPSFCSIAAVGFALTAYPIGVERGWIARADARRRTLATLDFFASAPMGPDRVGMSGHKGFFYHFLDMQTGTRLKQVELSSVDSTLLFLGILYAGEWFDGDHPDERRIRALAEQIVGRAEWPWFQQASGAISMGWHPESGFIERGWTGYNEGMMVVLLALGSAGHPVADGAWDAWTATYPDFWRGSGPTRHLGFAPLFGHQYSQMWIDFRGIQDATMRRARLDYFENSRRATIANRAYCIANPMRWEGYGRDIWGLTACDGPGDFRIPVMGKQRQLYGYAARGPVGFPDGLDDGTIAPTAALGSLAFAPEMCIPAGRAMRSWGGGRLYGKYGFFDSFNPTFRTGTPEKGRVDPHLGWVDDDYLGIDQGPILGAIANYRDGAIWHVMRKSTTIRRGLLRAGFGGGWLAA